MSRSPVGEDFDAIVAMGGPMSVNDEDEHPWLRDEKRLIGNAVRDGIPYWGACLGVQLLAASLGARVYPGDEPEVGLMPVTLTDAGRADPVLDGLPQAFTTLQWHGDTFDLPDRAVLLAGSAAYPHQAFRYERAVRRAVPPGGLARDGRSVGGGSHLRAYLDRVLGPGSLPPLIDELRTRGPEMVDRGRALFGNWLDAMVGTRA